MNNENIEIYKKEFSKFIEFIGKENNIPIPNTSYHLELFKKWEKPMQEIKDAHNLKSNLLNIDKESLKCQYNEDISNEKFKTLYMLQPFQIGETFKITKRENRKERCGECSFFGDKGCTTSYIEAKHGNKNTPACSEFSPKILGTKPTMIIIDDPLKDS